MLRGFARSRSSFDVAIQDLAGGFHALSLDDLASITDEKTSHMAAVKASTDELRDVIAYLSRLTGVRPGAVVPLPQGGRGGVPTRESISAGFSIRGLASGRHSTET